MSKLSRAIRRSIRARKLLQASGFVANFPDEGQQCVRLPGASFFDCLTTRGRIGIANSNYFVMRAGHEVLFRRMVYLLYRNGIISASRSVIDIGAWIGDNALVWANYLEGENARVIAIDPSRRNTNYITELAGINGIKNILPVTAVCSDRENRALRYENNIDHATFVSADDRAVASVYSTTIDSILEKCGTIDVGFFHIDVEGMEKAVLIGGMESIRRSSPVICFEQHIETDPLDDILKMLDGVGYVSYMVNEALPGNNLDCRNIFSFPVSIDIAKVVDLAQSIHTENPYYRLVPAGALIQLSPG